MTDQSIDQPVQLPFRPEEVRVADLAGEIATMEDAELVRALAEEDARPTARGVYERRLQELSDNTPNNSEPTEEGPGEGNPEADTGYLVARWAGREDVPVYVSTLADAPPFQTHDQGEMERFVARHRGDRKEKK